ncbi:Ppx/GppA phosphatase family protein [Tenacibaculum finnmarkense]|uniref:Ppx/GppA phosphatase N-terminal domain-containing protein n=1 Tax=Tenacibaculum finnmarkense genomovar finnmarkense TaxID=1458503 RepID=A0AAP1WHA2_9FLAO|nr:hypothetical protein [Tenacibaculum finnmarkense]MBE7653884.1 hypothetical protein [Tenacibaculum finnmarkense genomovar finnmarkense]MBE7696187.1 hypothetical protein [Tenacibaculum finnmarkense genomovar finnmarkense]MCD8428403.1 hypothetical protein [Tenacibaculum finnmarkense genomovar finnmarkense]MCG8732175.1 hypothetical protein [Tenacibaculum finnmarkense]MCG8752738.1 hypothetical protein [Tenacibaculum finnmarkense]
MTNICIIDIGSNTIKFHVKSNEDIHFKNSYNISWNILDRKRDDNYFDEILGKIKKIVTDFDEIIAIGTEALRNNATLEKRIIKGFNELNISYKTITQEVEAELIKSAVYKEPAYKGLNIINVGGGSIQIIDTSDNIFLFKFGISFLNSEFNLNKTPSERKSDECIKWIENQLPELTNSFIYSGGEKKYLESMNIKLQQEGYCLQSDFKELHTSMLIKPIDDLKKHSPFDPDWMQGAIASNCIVLAIMNKSNSNTFLPSDLNISNGVYEVLLEKETKVLI